MLHELEDMLDYMY